MHDWNGDGKYDFHDDYVYHKLIGPKDTKSSTGPGCGCLFAVLVVLMLIFGK